MPKNPLFSPYRQGENRVTSSMLAVFERMDAGLIEWLLRTTLGEETLTLVSFTNQIAKKDRRTVPDAAITASFKLLFEIKTVPNQPLETQCRDHLRHFDSTFQTERLFVVTPDVTIPDDLVKVGDARIAWFNFGQLNAAIEQLLVDSILLDVNEIVPEHVRFLLRELQAMFLSDGLLEPRDVVVLAARVAYPDYLNLVDAGHSSYACQPQRRFRDGIRYLGFYYEAAIQVEVPEIIAQRDDVEISRAEAERLSSSSDPEDQLFARQIARRLELNPAAEGATHKMFILSAPDNVRTLELPGRIANAKQNQSGGKAPWTYGQPRYLRSDVLREVMPGWTTSDIDGKH